MKGKKYVIVGASAAGTRAAEVIRSLEQDAAITIISDEELPFYSRCLLPGYLAGKIGGEEELFFQPRDFARKLSLKLILEEKVALVEPELEQVTGPTP